MNNLLSAGARSFGLSMLIMVSACSKTTTPPGTAALTVVNAIVGAASIEISNSFTNQPVNYNGSRQYSSHTGSFPFKPRLRDDLNYVLIDPPLYDCTLTLPAGSMYSLFMTGTLDHRDTLFVQDQPIAFSAKDSSMGIRFVHLSPGGDPVSINLATEPAGSEVSELAYKNITPFRTYKANAAVNAYTFEFRDAATGNLITTYTIDNINNTGSDLAPNLWRNKNITLVLDGLPGAGPDWPQTVFVVNNY